MIQATGQWAPHFCLNPKLFKFKHVQTGEPEARNLLATGSAEAAFTAIRRPAATANRWCNAPVAVTGFAITYVIDGANGQPYTQAAADAAAARQAAHRVLSGRCCRCSKEDPALSHNPLEHHRSTRSSRSSTPASRTGSTRREAAADAAGAVQRLRRDGGADDLHQRQPDGAGLAQRQARPVGHGGQPGVQGHQAAGRPVAAARHVRAEEALRARTTNDCLHNSPVPFLPLVAAPMAHARGHHRGDAVLDRATRRPSARRSTGRRSARSWCRSGRQTVGYRFMIGDHLARRRRPLPARHRRAADDELEPLRVARATRRCAPLPRS